MAYVYEKKGIQFYSTRKKAKNIFAIQTLSSPAFILLVLNVVISPHSNVSNNADDFNKQEEKERNFDEIFCISLIPRVSFLKRYNRRCKNKVVPCYKRS